jgi:hypothetical protein
LGLRPAAFDPAPCREELRDDTDLVDMEQLVGDKVNKLMQLLTTATTPRRTPRMELGIHKVMAIRQMVGQLATTSVRTTLLVPPPHLQLDIKPKVLKR